MVEASLGRDRLVQDGDGFATRRSRERFDLQAIERIATGEPTRLSPNVLLRPVVESALLPTVAYLGGPGELRYLALTPPVYQRLEVPRQLPLPRWSGVIVEPRVDRVMEKFGVALTELPGARRRARGPAGPLPAPAAGAPRRWSASGRPWTRPMAPWSAPRPRSIPRSRVPRRRRSSRPRGRAGLEKKLVQHLKRRQETELGQLARARTAVMPNGKPQERVLTVAPFLARYGPALLGELTSAFEAMVSRRP